ncbi:MAG TPA: hypothetical protein VG722_02705 [Tepidisphaeraceae bacterium]|nr:hypothetical protein [Tepidisphaeraceae bacterium]
MSKKRKSDIDEFIALPDAEKERIFKELDEEMPHQSVGRSRPLNKQDRARWRRFKAKMGRPKVGKGAKTISLTVEKELLRKADAYAKEHGMSRAKMVADGLRKVMGAAA